jgi:RNA polymerase sigma-70 factor (ECF subfamily)
MRRDDQGDAQQVSLTLREALEVLPDEQREVVVLRHLVGLSPGEIAGRLGKTEPAIHGLHHRGRGALRTNLAERECAPAVRMKAAA